MLIGGALLLAKWLSSKPSRELVSPVERHPRNTPHPSAEENLYKEIKGALDPYIKPLGDITTMIRGYLSPSQDLIRNFVPEFDGLFRQQSKKDADATGSPVTNQCIQGSSHVGAFITCLSFIKNVLEKFTEGELNQYLSDVFNKRIPKFNGCQHPMIALLLPERNDAQIPFDLNELEQLHYLKGLFFTPQKCAWNYYKFHETNPRQSMQNFIFLYVKPESKDYSAAVEFFNRTETLFDECLKMVQDYAPTESSASVVHR